MPKNNLPINVTADDRECKSEVIASLMQIEDADIIIRRLSMGDYQIDNRLIVERKTLKDFAISIIDGRLFKQMVRLANSKSEGVLILEGTVSDTIELGMTRESMQGALITVSLILGIPVLRSKDPSDNRQINCLYRPPNRINGQGRRAPARLSTEK
jgi:ERCC4-type nuclease